MENRIEYLDNAKGILIISMVLGHVFLEGPIRHFIYTFHMPAFLIIVGMLFHSRASLDKPIFSFLLSRVRTLLIPFVFFECIGVFTDIVCHGVSINVKGYCYNIIMQQYNNGPDGFLIHLFGAEIIFLIFYKILHNNKILHASAGIMVMLLAFGVKGQTYSLIRIVGIYCGFITVGYYLFSQIKSSKGLIIMALIITIAVSYQGFYIDETFGNPIIGMIYFCGAVCGSYVVLSISKLIHSKLLAYYGKNTLTVLGTHNAILFPIRTYITSSFSIFSGMVVFIFIIFLEFPIMILFEKFVPVLVGKRPKNGLHI